MFRLIVQLCVLAEPERVEDATIVVNRDIWHAPAQAQLVQVQCLVLAVDSALLEVDLAAALLLVVDLLVDHARLHVINAEDLTISQGTVKHKP